MADFRKFALWFIAASLLFATGCVHVKYTHTCAVNGFPVKCK